MGFLPHPDYNPLCAQTSDPTRREATALQPIRCPECNGADIYAHTIYTVQSGERRTVYACPNCGIYFSETYHTPLAGLRQPLSFISRVIEALNDGLGINAACRTFHVGKNTL